jgi:hypothetical protein
MELMGNLLPNEPECLAIVDYYTHVQRIAGPQVRCPISPFFVDIHGTIGQTPIHERITPCLGGADAAARHDARIILHWRPATLLVGGA